MIHIDLKTDLDTYNKNAYQWLETLIYANYDVKVDLSQFILLTDCLSANVELENKSPKVLFRNIIFLINGLEEYYCNKLDHYDRFPSSESLLNQKELLQHNVVDCMIKDLLQFLGVSVNEKPSKMLLSHDIDTLHTGRIYELVKAAKTADFKLATRVVTSFIKNQTTWKNLFEIKELIQQYGYTSTFYFLSQKGRHYNIKNSDYQMTDEYVTSFLNQATNDGFEIGLHKSTMPTTLDKEINKISNHNNSNRHHFLRYTLPDLYRKLNSSIIKTDSSLCFPYNMGFRNGYGLPFKPFDLEYGVTLNVLEIPFQMMDGMFPTDTPKEADNSYNQITDFISNNKNNAVLGMLWHNTELSEMAHPYSQELFKRILSDLKEHRIEVTTPKHIFRELDHKWDI